MPNISETEYMEYIELKRKKERLDKKWREHQSSTEYKRRKAETNRKYYLEVTKAKKQGRRIV